MLAKVPIDVMWLAVGMAGLIIVIIAAGIVRDRRRRLALSAILAERGFEMDDRPDRRERSRLFEPFAAAANLRSGARGVRWGASGRAGTTDVRVIEHRYVVSTGKSSHAIVNLCVAAVGRSGGDWPLLTLGPEGWHHRLGETLGARPDIRVEDEQFNRRWRVRCSDEGFALAVLTPAVQEALAGSDAKEWWCIGGPGASVCVGRTASATAEALDGLLMRLEKVLGAMAPELRAALGLGSVGNDPGGVQPQSRRAASS